MTRPITPGTRMLKPRHTSDGPGNISHPTQGSLPLRGLLGSATYPTQGSLPLRGLLGSATAIHQVATRLVMAS